MTIREYCVHTDAPSTIAASVSSTGMVRMKLLSTKTQKPVWKATLMMTRPNVESYSSPELLRKVGMCTLMKILNKGESSTCCGSRFPAVNSSSMMRLKRKLNRATMKATHDARNKVMMTAGTVILTEFQKKCGICPCV